MPLLVSLCVCAAPAEAGEGQADALERWRSVLERAVDAEGRIDFDAIAAAPGDLDAFVAWIGRHGPGTTAQDFASPAAVLAYHLNAYNALAMAGVVDEGIPGGFDSVFKRAAFFTLRKITVDGRRTSLHAYENEVIRKLGDPRVHFALNCMARACPRLAREPFTAAHVDAQLDAAAREFLNSPRHIRLDAAKRELWLSEILDFYTEDFVGSDDRHQLIAYVNRYRDEPVPADFEVRFIPYDWTVNRQP